MWGELGVWTSTIPPVVGQAAQSDKIDVYFEYSGDVRTSYSV
jgi:glycine betaine/choline ABC-type transport system substrate-binding protein